MKRLCLPLSKYRGITAAWHPSLLERERHACKSRLRGAASNRRSSISALNWGQRLTEIWISRTFNPLYLFPQNLHNVLLSLPQSQNMFFFPPSLKKMNSNVTQNAFGGRGGGIWSVCIYLCLHLSFSSPPCSHTFFSSSAAVQTSCWCLSLDLKFIWGQSVLRLARCCCCPI